MANIKPFQAIRPRTKYVEKVSTLPYDVFSEKEAREIVARNPHSFLKIVRPETVFPKNVDIYSNQVYEKAKSLIQENIEKGIFVEENKECYYIYREVMNGRTQTGLVATFAVDDYLNNVIKRHEYTRQEKEDDRTRHIDICSAQTGLVFLAFHEGLALRIMLEKATHDEPLYDFFSEDNVRQLVWKVDDPEKVAKITEAFKTVNSLYIADGHHRCASAASVCKKRREEHPDYDGTEEFNYFMAVAFPSENLLVLPYYRVVKDLNGLTTKKFLEKIEEAGFEVRKLSRMFVAKERKHKVNQPRRKGEIAMHLGGRWYQLIAKPEILKEDAVGCLDVTMLQENILKPILGIQDPRTDQRIDFVGGIRGMGELEKRCREDMKAAFALYPTSMEELIRITEEGKVMPPKSTWFEPKLQSGLFVHKI
ncbi:MAG: DUF1015 family protein [Lachnospiraceae bacterium]|nr:DUF1015 family protein [Lachnospiraceae bacterium]